MGDKRIWVAVWFSTTRNVIHVSGKSWMYISPPRQTTLVLNFELPLHSSAFFTKLLLAKSFVDLSLKFICREREKNTPFTSCSNRGRVWRHMVSHPIPPHIPVCSQFRCKTCRLQIFLHHLGQSFSWSSSSPATLNFWGPDSRYWATCPLNFIVLYNICQIPNPCRPKIDCCIS